MLDKNNRKFMWELTYKCESPEAKETVDLKRNNIKWLTVSQLG